MSYPKIVQQLTGAPWCITRAMHDSMMGILAARIEGKTAMTAMTDFSEAAMRPMPQGRANPDVAKNDSGPYDSLRVGNSTLSKRGQLGIIPIDGVMGVKMSMFEQMCGGCSTEAIQQAIEMAYNDPSISRVLFDISSPGGMACLTAETADMLSSLSKKKETFSVAVDICGSAAQWVAAQCRTCYGTANGVYGSIGCFIAKLDLSKQREQDGENLQIIRAGKFKAMGADAPLTESERAILQTIVDENMAQFQSAVVAGRAAYSKKKIAPETMEGQIFSGNQAVQNGLLDALVPSVISMVRQLS